MNFISATIDLLPSKHEFKLKLQHFHTSQWTRTRVRGCRHSILETCAYQSRIYKSAFYSYNFHIFRLFGFDKDEVDVYRFMSKQLTSPCAYVMITSDAKIAYL